MTLNVQDKVETGIGVLFISLHVSDQSINMDPNTSQRR